MSKLLRNLIAGVFSLSTALVVACAPGSGNPDSEDLQGADETVETGEDGVSGSLTVGTQLVSTTGVNLRSGASTSKSILYTIPQGSTVTVQQAAPNNGFYKVKHNGTVGWSYGAYYNVKSVPPPVDEGGDDPPAPGGVREQALQRAKASMGFSYWWGHGRFKDSGVTSSTAGSCSGSCPSCSHSGQYGGDCSGFAAKVWQVPSTNTDLSDDEHPYSTADFNENSSRWSIISRNDLQVADAMVYRSGGAGHIFIYEKGDPWGSPYAYECKGCSAGCVSGFRSVSSAYKAITPTAW